MNNEQAANAVITELRRANGYAARLEIERILATRAPLHLEPHGFKIYSQNGEDGMIEEIFRRLDMATGKFCEIGVENGLECNTLYLLHKGWRGKWLDGNPDQATPICSKFASVIENRRLTFEGVRVTPENINDLVPSDIDFLSIDVDGMDIYLLEALRPECKPAAICIEYNSKFPYPLRKMPVYAADYAWAGTDYMGSSLAAIEDTAKAKGYQLVGTDVSGVNAFFVRADLVGDKFAMTDLYNPPRYWLTADAFVFCGHRADFGRYVDLQ